MTNININIPNDLHKKSKRKALDKEITLKEFIIESIEKEVK